MKARKIGGRIRTLGWLAVASMLGMAMLAPSVSAATGAIWTTAEPCATPAPQDQNHYAIGAHVYVRGDNFDPNTSYAWSVTGNPGGSSGDPGIVVASGTVLTDGTGYFCVDAYTVQPGDWGEYKVDAAGKQDNYRVDGVLVTDPPVTDPPVTDPPVTDPPVTDPPVTDPPTESPSGGVLAATGTPITTLPPTDGVVGGAAPASDTWRIVLIGMAGLLASALVLTPAKASRRR